MIRSFSKYLSKHNIFLPSKYDLNRYSVTCLNKLHGKLYQRPELSYLNTPMTSLPLSTESITDSIKSMPASTADLPYLKPYCPSSRSLCFSRKISQLLYKHDACTLAYNDLKNKAVWIEVGSYLKHYIRLFKKKFYF